MFDRTAFIHDIDIYERLSPALQRAIWHIPLETWAKLKDQEIDAILAGKWSEDKILAKYAKKVKPCHDTTPLYLSTQT